MGEVQRTPADHLLGLPAQDVGDAVRDPLDDAVGGRAHDEVRRVLGEQPVALLALEEQLVLLGQRVVDRAALGDVVRDDHAGEDGAGVVAHRADPRVDHPAAVPRHEGTAHLAVAGRRQLGGERSDERVDLGVRARFAGGTQRAAREQHLPVEVDHDQQRLGDRVQGRLQQRQQVVGVMGQEALGALHTLRPLDRQRALPRRRAPSQDDAKAPPPAHARRGAAAPPTSSRSPPRSGQTVRSVPSRTARDPDQRFTPWTDLGRW